MDRYFVGLMVALLMVSGYGLLLVLVGAIYSWVYGDGHELTVRDWEQRVARKGREWADG